MLCKKTKYFSHLHTRLVFSVENVLINKNTDKFQQYLLPHNFSLRLILFCGKRGRNGSSNCKGYRAVVLGSCVKLLGLVSCSSMFPLLLSQPGKGPSHLKKRMNEWMAVFPSLQHFYTACLRIVQWNNECGQCSWLTDYLTPDLNATYCLSFWQSANLQDITINHKFGISICL